ncbi:MAG: magnesium transporter [Alphaproteobacteria bacterium]
MGENLTDSDKTAAAPAAVALVPETLVSETLPSETLPPALVHSVVASIEAGNRDAVSRAIEPLHQADLADLIEFLSHDQRADLVKILGAEFDVGVLTELEEALKTEMLDLLPAERVVEGVKTLATDDAVYLLEDLEADEQAQILAKLPAPERAVVKRNLDYPPECAGRLMQSEFVAVPPYWTVGQTVDFLRTEMGLPQRFYEVFVVDPTFHLLGTVPLDRLVCTRRPVALQNIMQRKQTQIPVTQDQEDVAYRFEQYNLVSAAVIDEDSRIVGVITIDDIVDVIQKEAEEDLHRLAGVGDEELTDSVWRTARGRFSWLAVNLATAVGASAVIYLFDATLEKMVALAILMPIIASMGGNAAIQTMAVSVRALATNDLIALNARRVVWRELLVGLINGLSFAVLAGVVAAVWFASYQLGLIVGVAMMVNMFVAGLSGILIPLGLARFNIDPAIASSVFVTTVTDVVGFFAFLGLAAVWLA